MVESLNCAVHIRLPGKHEVTGTYHYIPLPSQTLSSMSCEPTNVKAVAPFSVNIRFVYVHIYMTILNNLTIYAVCLGRQFELLSRAPM